MFKNNIIHNGLLRLPKGVFYLQRCELLKKLHKETHKVFFTRYYYKLLKKSPLKKLAELCNKHDLVLMKIKDLYENLKNVIEWGYFFNSYDVWRVTVENQIERFRSIEVEIIQYIDDKTITIEEQEYIGKIISSPCVF